MSYNALNDRCCSEWLCFVSRDSGECSPIITNQGSLITHQHHLPVFELSDELGLLPVPLLHLDEVVSFQCKGRLQAEQTIFEIRIRRISTH